MSQQSQLHSSSTSAESRQEKAAAASVTRRANNWVDAEIRLLIDLRGDDRAIDIAHETGARKTAVVSESRFLQISTSIVTDSPPSSLRASREIHDHHRVANWCHFCCAMQVNR